MTKIRRCGDEDLSEILTIINSAAEAYRGVIPPDLWHEPYMLMEDLRRDISSGVSFWGVEVEGQLIGVMGMQPVRDVELIRHAYVLPGRQRQGVGAALMEHICRQATRRILVGTWAAATWAIDFYARHGFMPVPPERQNSLMRTYWKISDRQIETSVVLANAPLPDSTSSTAPARAVGS